MLSRLYELLKENQGKLDACVATEMKRILAREKALFGKLPKGNVFNWAKQVALQNVYMNANLCK